MLSNSTDTDTRTCNSRNAGHKKQKNAQHYITRCMVKLYKYRSECESLGTFCNRDLSSLTLLLTDNSGLIYPISLYLYSFSLEAPEDGFAQSEQVKTKSTTSETIMPGLVQRLNLLASYLMTPVSDVYDLSQKSHL